MGTDLPSRQRPDDMQSEGGGIRRAGLSYTSARYRVRCLYPCRSVLRGRSSIGHIAAAVLLVLFQARAGRAQRPDLTQSSLEDLMNIEVASVSKKEPRTLQAPAAVFVIAAEDIGAGATNLPYALRMVGPPKGSCPAEKPGWQAGGRIQLEAFVQHLQRDGHCKSRATGALPEPGMARRRAGARLAWPF